MLSAPKSPVVQLPPTGISQVSIAQVQGFFSDSLPTSTCFFSPGISYLANLIWDEASLTCPHPFSSQSIRHSSASPWSGMSHHPNWGFAFGGFSAGRLPGHGSITELQGESRAGRGHAWLQGGSFLGQNAFTASAEVVLLRRACHSSCSGGFLTSPNL